MKSTLSLSLKAIPLLLLALSLQSVLPAQSQNRKPKKAPRTQRFAPAAPEYDGFLVAFKSDTPLQARINAIQQKGLVRDSRLRNPHFALLRPGPAALNAGQNLHTILDSLRRDPRVRVAEPNYIVRASFIPNDTRFDALWGLHNAADADIDAPEAWDITMGSANVKVAVLDSGVDYNHPDLAANIARDAQGRLIGYDFVNNDSDPMDDHGHGTHCAGTIGALGNNSRGVIGVSPNVRIIPLKFMRPNREGTASGSTSAAIQCVDYAITHGAHIISCSFVDSNRSQLMAEAIQRARQANVLVVASAGNEGTNNDRTPYYPASFNTEFDNVISVASTTHQDEISGFSNYGAQSVDIAAPGSSILSTIPGGGYGSKNGTSMATPHVSGAAALIKARFPSLGYQGLKTRLLGSVDVLPALDGKVNTKGRLNAHRALAEADATAPAKPQNLAATHRATTMLRLQWTAPGDDDMTGTATRYEMRYSTSLITEANFADATLAAGVVPPAASGTTQAHLLTGLRADTSYYVAMKSIDDGGNVSSIALSGPHRTLATPSMVYPFTDDAEGAAKFSGPAPWGQTTESAASPTRSYTDTPGTPYNDNRDDALTQNTQVALTDFVPELRFQARTSLEEDYDFLYVEVSTDNGQNWNQHLALTGTQAWQEYRLALAQYAGASVRIRFRLVTDYSVTEDGVWLDDIRIGGERLEPIAPAPSTVSRLAWQNTKNGDASYWRLSGTAFAASGTLARAIPLDWQMVGAPDVNQDGKRDLLWHNMKTGDVSYWLMNGTTMTGTGILYRGVPLVWQPVAVGDFNEDGKADLLWQNMKNGDVSYWLLNGTAIAGTGYLARAVPTDWQIAAAIDLDGDSSTDLLWRNSQNGDLTYWLLDGTRLSVTGTLARAVPLDWRIGGVADIDTDGDSDLIWHNISTGDVSFWKLQDGRTAGTGILYRGVPREWQLRTAF